MLLRPSSAPSARRSLKNREWEEEEEDDDLEDTFSGVWASFASGRERDPVVDRKIMMKKAIVECYGVPLTLKKTADVNKSLRTRTLKKLEKCWDSSALLDDNSSNSNNSRSKSPSKKNKKKKLADKNLPLNHPQRFINAALNSNEKGKEEKGGGGGGESSGTTPATTTNGAAAAAAVVEGEEDEESVAVPNDMFVKFNMALVGHDWLTAKQFAEKIVADGKEEQQKGAVEAILAAARHARTSSLSRLQSLSPPPRKSTKADSRYYGEGEGEGVGEQEGEKKEDGLSPLSRSIIEKRRKEILAENDSGKDMTGLMEFGRALATSDYDKAMSLSDDVLHSPLVRGAGVELIMQQAKVVREKSVTSFQPPSDALLVFNNNNNHNMHSRSSSSSTLPNGRYTPSAGRRGLRPSSAPARRSSSSLGLKRPEENGKIPSSERSGGAGGVSARSWMDGNSVYSASNAVGNNNNINSNNINNNSINSPSYVQSQQWRPKVATARAPKSPEPKKRESLSNANNNGNSNSQSSMSAAERRERERESDPSPDVLAGMLKVTLMSCLDLPDVPSDFDPNILLKHPSAFGFQPDSTRPSSPSFSFGSSPRFAPRTRRQK